MRRFFVSFVFAVFFATAVAESEQYDDEFEAFVHRFSKVYSTPEERTMRKSLWLSRKQQYDLLNSQHNGATFAVNGFGDMTDAELDAMLMHPTIPSREEAALVEARAEPPTITDPEHPRHHKRATPTHWNWCNSSDFGSEFPLFFPCTFFLMHLFLFQPMDALPSSVKEAADRVGCSVTSLNSNLSGRLQSTSCCDSLISR